jgi:hypothetical protein
METTFQAQHSKVSEAKTQVSTAQMQSQGTFWENAEKNRFGIIAMLLVFVTCLAGVAAAAAADASTFRLAAVAATAMAVESLILAVMSMRSIIIASIISVVVSLLVIIF